MIYVTGDTHADSDSKKLFDFAKRHPELTKSDFVIIAGDFGGVWSAKTLEDDLNYFGRLPFTLLFVDGNHENFDLINSYPVEIWNGGKVHKIRPDIIHLMRGQIFEIEGKTIFTFGGATSIDKAFRREGFSWWPQELPTFEELDEGLANLKRYNYTVDYLITHSCGQRALTYPQLRITAGIKIASPESQLLSNFEDIVNFKHWYFGHFHIDAKLSDKFTALMHEVVRLDAHEKLEKIKEILNEEYGDAMSYEMLKDFANDMYDSLFVGEYDLSDIFALANDYESNANIEDGKAFDIFTDLLDLLDNGVKTAQRLYESFMHEADLLETFLKLYNENAEYISEEKLAEAKKKAFEVFDRQMLESLGITE